MIEYREAVSEWYKRRFNVSFDAKTEVLALIGSKEGIAHVPEAFVNPGDYVLATDPGYPVYKTSTLFSEGILHELPLKEENDYLPELDKIPADVLKKAKLMFFGYPNNPTSATAPLSFFAEVVEFAKENNIVAVHDNAYSEIAFDGYKAPSFMEVDGAKEVGMEMHSLSKTYNMTGWRLGMAVGGEELIAGLGRVKTNVDSGAFDAIQRAGITALTSSQQCVADACNIYQKRRDTLVSGLRSLGFDVRPPKATFYVWMKVNDSMKFAEKMLNEAGIVVTPGVGFGKSGDGYVRFAITRDVERINEAIERMKGLEF
jgi:LL-diaminopimelate aminotransferase